MGWKCRDQKYIGGNVQLDRKQSGGKYPFTKLNMYNIMTVHLQMIFHSRVYWSEIAGIRHA